METTATETIYSLKEVANILTKRILPTSAKALNERSIARMCKLGRFPRAYLAQGDWCVYEKDLEEFIQATLQNNGGRKYTKRRTKTK